VEERDRWKAGSEGMRAAPRANEGMCTAPGANEARSGARKWKALPLSYFVCRRDCLVVEPKAIFYFKGETVVV
jgi:hypothetical protein